MNVNTITFADSQVASSASSLWVDSEPSNIVKLSEDGLLLPNAQAEFSDELSYDYSPLNEW